MTTEIGGFEERGEQVFHSAHAGEREWMGRDVEEEEIDPRIQFIRELVFAYMYHLVITPEKLPAFEQMLLKTIFDDDEIEPSNFVEHFPHPVPTLV